MYNIRKATVLGSGTMGSAIASHLANAGIEVLLLDLKASDKHPNQIAEDNLQKTITSKPSPLFSGNVQKLISIGNFSDDLEKIKTSDWIIEAVLEDAEVKKDLYRRVNEFISDKAILTTNTSGLPIKELSEDMSASLAERFFGTHFFNPPRYLQLLEVIPGPDTKKKIVQKFKEFAEYRLGKTPVIANDKPAFIANRIGVFTMAKIFELAEELRLPLHAIDKLTGPALERPKTGTFRLADLVGLDVAYKVTEDIKERAPKDRMITETGTPPFLLHLMDKNYFGNKSGKGFYYKTGERDGTGKSIIKELDLETLEYVDRRESDLKSLKLIKQISDPQKRLNALIKADDKGGELIRRSTAATLAYAAYQWNKAADNIAQIDEALKAGFGWKHGPFELWDLIGYEKGKKLIKNEGFELADWLPQEEDFTFYKVKNGNSTFFDPNTKKYRINNISPVAVRYELLEKEKIVFSNEELTVYDIGNDVLAAEFTSQQNAIGEGILQGMMEVLDMMEEEDWRGLVIGHNKANFSVGANLMLIGMLAFQQHYDQLNMAVDLFQQVNMRVRYSSKPVVVATKGYVFGGGCEMLMHSNFGISAAESYIGLVEAGVGLIPGAGGTKEMALRLSRDLDKEGVMIPELEERFKTVAMGKVAKSAAEAFEYHYLTERKDELIMHSGHILERAKDKILSEQKVFHPGSPASDITIAGKDGLAALYIGINEMKNGKWISEYDAHVAKKLAYVFCGGELSGREKVTEQYLLDLEKEAFLSLCGEQKTLERIQYMLEHNKPLRN